jgi:hypothetical protein
MIELPLYTVILAAIVAVLGVGRLTRVIVHDAFPPSAWLRAKWDDLTGENDWNKLFHCWWCMSFWVTALCFGHFLLGFLAVWIAWTWWLFWGGLAVSYLAAIVISRDEP